MASSRRELEPSPSIGSCPLYGCDAILLPIPAPRASISGPDESYVSLLPLESEGRILWIASSAMNRWMIEKSVGRVSHATHSHRRSGCVLPRSPAPHTSINRIATPSSARLITRLGRALVPDSIIGLRSHWYKALASSGVFSPGASILHPLSLVVPCDNGHLLRRQRRSCYGSRRSS